MLIFDKIECCNSKTKGRVYYIDERRYLIFIDSCFKCHCPIAEIRVKNSKGEYKVNVRRRGESAIKLYEKYSLNAMNNWKIPFGTRSGEYTFINKFGTIFNENGVRIAPQKDFLSMTREEVNMLLNGKRMALNL